MKNKIKILMLLAFIAILGHSCMPIDSPIGNEEGKSNDSQLSDLTISSGSITNFFGATYSYNVDVGSDVESITVSPVASDLGASIKVNNLNVISGSSSSSISLETGVNTINVLVTAEDGTTRNYSLVINRLSPLVVESLTLSADWHEGTLIAGEEMWYSFSVVSGVTYTISWEDYYNYITLGMAKIEVSATNELTNGTDFFTDETFSQNITPDYTGLVYIKVSEWMSNSSGTFLIKVE